MTKMDRREFGKLAGAAGLTAMSSAAFAPIALGQSKGKVVIVGGGAGGATVAHYVKKGAPSLDVTLIEVRPRYTTCFFSNLYLGGFRNFDSITHGYEGLRRLGVKVVTDLATAVDTDKRIVRTRKSGSFSYDKLVLSPGIEIKFDTVAGYSPTAAQTIPHAWIAGSQTRILKRQLEAMRNGGTVILAPPPNPYRCPPGPYERACMIAHYLKTRKPKSKLIILDPKKSFSKQPVFMEAFNRYYKDIVEVNLTNEIDDFSVVKVDAKSRMVWTKSGRREKGDVINLVPAQRAGNIAQKAGATNGDWCPIDPSSFASTRVKDVYVLGDASIATMMPKSAFSANSQAKIVANDVLAALASQRKFPARTRNTCWSLVAPNDSVKVGANYTPGDKDGKKQLVAADSFVSKAGEDAGLRKLNYEESVGWYDGITTDMFAKTAAAAPGKGSRPNRGSKG